MAEALVANLEPSMTGEARDSDSEPTVRSSPGAVLSSSDVQQTAGRQSTSGADAVQATTTPEQVQTKRSSGRSKEGPHGSAAEMERDDAVETGEGLAEETESGSAQSLNEVRLSQVGLADPAAESRESTETRSEPSEALTGDDGTEGGTEAAAETAAESSLGQVETEILPRGSGEGDQSAAAVPEPQQEAGPSGRTSNTSERVSGSSLRASRLSSREAGSGEGPNRTNDVARELNMLLGNPEAAAEAVMMSADAVGSSGQGEGEIEGFDDDFQIPQAPPPPEDLPAAEPEEAPDPEGDRLAAQVQEAREENARLLAENKALQKRCALLLTARPAGGMAMEGSLLDEEMHYRTSLLQWVAQSEELRRVSGMFDGAIERSKDELQARQDSAVQIRSNYLQLEMEVAREAENSRTGRPMPTKTLRQLAATGRAKDEELESIRLKSIIMKNTLSGLERALKRREELADGLHQVDFEQLKIENQSLSEKIKVRDEELAKLRKKVSTTVHILTHQKEKLQHVHRDAEAEGLLLEAVEKEVVERRDKLQRAKRARDTALAENKNLKLASGLITQPELLRDVAAQRELVETLSEKVNGLQQRHATLTASLTRVGLSGMSTPLGLAHSSEAAISVKGPLHTVKSGTTGSGKSGRLEEVGRATKEGGGRLASRSTGHTPLSTSRSSENVPKVAISATRMKVAVSP